MLLSVACTIQHQIAGLSTSNEFDKERKEMTMTKFVVLFAATE
jgi:hypothetical protein